MRASARAVALDALLRIDEGAYANLVLPPLLSSSGLDERDRGFVTELVYGTTRRQRSCDFLVDRHLQRDVEPAVRAALRLGAYQLHFLDTKAHAAVSATVDVAPPRARGLVNAVLRKVAADKGVRWPDPPTALSYPDWVVERLAADLGPDRALAALETMNEPARVTVRDDGYVQDLASQWVADLVEVQPGDRVADLCSAPGGKATAMARHQPAVVVAGEVSSTRAGLVANNVERLGAGTVSVIGADGRRPPLRPRAFDRVLVDAPCSGLGVLRRRPDARWRIEAGDVPRLVTLQTEILDGAIDLLRPGGRLVYSVCTLTAAETVGVDEWLAANHPRLRPVEPPGSPWEPVGRGARLLPQTAGTDGMYLLRLERS